VRIRATLKLRNDAMISAREAKGWSQGDLASACGTSIDRIVRLEKMDFSLPCPNRADRDNLPIRRYAFESLVASVATALAIPTETVAPSDAVIGQAIEADCVRVAEIPMSRLLSANSISRKYLPMEAEIDAISAKTQVDDLLRQTPLTFRERMVVNWMHGLNGQQELSLRETAKELRVTRERARQIHMKALRKLSRSSQQAEDASRRERRRAMVAAI